MIATMIQNSGPRKIFCAFVLGSFFAAESALFFGALFFEEKFFSGLLLFCLSWLIERPIRTCALQARQ